MSDQEAVDQEAVDDQGDATELPPAVDGMARVMGGEFALYQRSDGSMEIFYDVGEGVVRKRISAKAVSVVMGNGPVAGMLRKALGG